MRNATSVLAAAFCVFITAAVMALGPVVPVLEVMPYCQYPRQVVPMQAIGGMVSNTQSAVAWNGKDYGVVWVDYADHWLHFRRFFADGTPASAPVIVWSSSTCQTGASPSLVWNGSGYAVAWVQAESTLTVLFGLLDASGNLTKEVTAASSTKSTNWPSLAFGGSSIGYAVVWTDSRSTRTVRARRKRSAPSPTSLSLHCP